jgi:hypothetical protein
MREQDLERQARAVLDAYQYLGARVVGNVAIDPTTDLIGELADRVGLPARFFFSNRADKVTLSLFRLRFEIEPCDRRRICVTVATLMVAMWLVGADGLALNVLGPDNTGFNIYPVGPDEVHLTEVYVTTDETLARTCAAQPLGVA